MKNVLFTSLPNTEFLDGQGKVQRTNVLLPLLTDLFKLLLRSNVLPSLEKDKSYTYTQET